MFHNQEKKNTRRTPPPSGYTDTLSAIKLIENNKYQHLIDKIYASSALERARFNSTVLPLIHQIANYYQGLPETANSYYALPGGLLHHALNRTEAALELCHHFMLQEQEGVLSEKQKLWLYTLCGASLLRGIGKLPMDYQVTLHEGQASRQWNPLLESLAAVGLPYHYQFKKECEKELRCRLNLILARTLMPNPGFNWIASDPDVLTIWLALLDEDDDGAGTLGAILEYADAIAISRYLTDYSHRLIHAGGGGGAGSRPHRLNTFADTPPLSLLDKEHLIGVEFIKWMTNALAGKKIMINKAPLMVVPGGLIMLPEMFQLFVREHPEYKNAQAVEKGFLSWGLHRLRQDGRIIFTNYAVALPKEVHVHHPITHQSTAMSALDYLRQSHTFNKTKSWASSTPMRYLSPHGEWVRLEGAPNSLKPGATHRG